MSELAEPVPEENQKGEVGEEINQEQGPLGYAADTDVVAHALLAPEDFQSKRDRDDVAAEHETGECVLAGTALGDPLGERSLVLLLSIDGSREDKADE